MNTYWARQRSGIVVETHVRLLEPEAPRNPIAGWRIALLVSAMCWAVAAAICWKVAH